MIILLIAIILCLIICILILLKYIKKIKHEKYIKNEAIHYLQSFCSENELYTQCKKLEEMKIDMICDETEISIPRSVYEKALIILHTQCAQKQKEKQSN